MMFIYCCSFSFIAALCSSPQISQFACAYFHCWAPRLFPVGADISQTALIMHVSVSLCVHVCAIKCVCMTLCVYIKFYCNKAPECFVSFCGRTASSWCRLSLRSQCLWVWMEGCEETHASLIRDFCTSAVVYCCTNQIINDAPLIHEFPGNCSSEAQGKHFGKKDSERCCVVFSVSESTRCCRSQGFCCCVETP